MGAHQWSGKHMLRARMPPVPVPTWREGGLGKGGGKTVARHWLRATSSPQGVAKRTRIVLPAGEPSYRRQRKLSVPVCGLRTRLCTARDRVPFEVARAMPFDDGEPGATPTASASQTVTPPSDGRDVGPDISKSVRQWASDKGLWRTHGVRYLAVAHLETFRDGATDMSDTFGWRGHPTTRRRGEVSISYTDQQIREELPGSGDVSSGRSTGVVLGVS